MATGVSLKERMKQLQALKSEVQVKSQATVARQKELENLITKSPVKSLSQKFTVLNINDDGTAENETQTTVAESSASRALPEPPLQAEEKEVDETPLNEIEEDKEKEEVETQVQESEEDKEEEKEKDEEHQTLSIEDEKEEDIEEYEEEIVDEDNEEGKGEDEEEEEEEEVIIEEEGGDDAEEEIIDEDEEDIEMVEENDEGNSDDEIEVIEEEVFVEGNLASVEVQEKEEYVEVEKSNRSEEVFETVKEPEVMDEKMFDEYAYNRHPEIAIGSQVDEEAPEDEMAFLDTEAERLESQRDSIPFDEKSSGMLPVFTALDEAEVEDQTAEESADLNAVGRSTMVSTSRRSTTTAPNTPLPSSGGLPRGFYDEEKRRWNFILCCLLIIGLCASTALILPFMVDYDSIGNDPTLSPTVSPAPSASPSANPTMNPTISPAPTRPPTQEPSVSPSISAAPTGSPTASPTEAPTLSPTPVPTQTPVVSPTAAPVTPPVAGPTAAPVAQPTIAPVTPTIAPIPLPTVAPVAPTVTTPSPTSQRLDNFIQVFAIPISGEASFEDQNSAQFKAAQFIAEDDPFTSEILDEQILTERYGLVTFYYGTGGETWSQCGLGSLLCANPWLTGDVCGWEGISCNGQGRVISISFDGTSPVGLTGSLPPELYVLSLLEELTIVNESVGGTLPDRFGIESSSIRTITIEGTQIEGTLPFAFMNDSQIQSLVLRSNNLAGEIPFELGNFDTLTVVDLSQNRFTGTIPAGLVRYRSLEILALDENVLAGSIPDAYYTMQSLQRLHVNGNGFMRGSISPAIGGMVSLQGLRAGVTGIGGLLPDELFALANLEELDLRDARFQGPLPSVISALSLQRVFLQENSFTGTIPVAFGDLNNLEILNLEGNDFVGSIAPEICELRDQGLDELTVDCDQVACSCCTQCFR